MTAPPATRSWLPVACGCAPVTSRTDFWALGTSTVYRRRPLADIGYFDARLGSLGDALANRLLAFRYGFYFDPAVLAAYVANPMSFSAARSALSVDDSRRLLAAAASWIAENLPADVRDEHGPLFDRSHALCLARRVIWGKGQIKTNIEIADLLNFGPFDRAIYGVLARLPVGGELSHAGLDDPAHAPLQPGGYGRSLVAGLTSSRFGQYRRGP